MNDMVNSLSSRRARAHFDWPLLAAVYLLSLFGVLCIAVAMFDPDKGMDLSWYDNILSSRSGQMQCVWLLISPLVLGGIMMFPMEMYRARLNLIYLGVLGLLTVTMVLATTVNGIKSWLNTGFGRAIQPCEFAKLSVMLALAKELSSTEKPMANFREFVRICLIVGVPAMIVLLQGETGSVIVIGAMFLIMLFFSGVDIRIVLGIVAVLLIGIAFIVVYALVSNSDDYRILRLLAFTDPEKYSSSGGYQLLQAQKAIGAGELTGVGIFQLGSMATLQFVPESSTDFIFSVIGESFGFVGSMIVLGLYMFIILRLLVLARYTADKFGKLVIIGVMGMLFFHVFENIAMNTGLMPITGIPLPFISYGGSNYITNMAGIALVLNVTNNRSSAAGSYLQLPQYKKTGILRGL